MDSEPPTVDPLTAVLAVLDAGDALAAAVRLATEAADWQAAADDAALTLGALSAALRPPATMAAGPALGRAA